MYHQAANSVGNGSYNIFLYQNTTYAMHFHRNYEIICVISGEVSVKTAHFEKLLFEKEILILPPNEPHGFSVSGELSKIWVGVFSEDHIDVFARNTQGVCFSSFVCSDETWEFLRNRYLYQKNPDLLDRIAFLYLICAECEKRAEKLYSRENSDLIFEILSYVDRRFRENPTLAETAKDLGYEYHYFSSLFHAYFAMNFRDFLNIHRFEYACELMKKSEKSLTEIAMESGFGSVRSFNRIFLLMSGMRPNEYRKEYRT